MPRGVYARTPANTANRSKKPKTDLAVKEQDQIVQEHQEENLSISERIKDIDSLIGSVDKLITSRHGTVALPEKSDTELQAEQITLHDAAIKSIQHTAAIVQFAVMLNQYGPEQIGVMLQGLSRMGNLQIK